MSTDPTVQCRVVVVGAPGVGKTTLLKHIKDGSFADEDGLTSTNLLEQNQPKYTILDPPFTKKVLVDGESYEFSFTDTGDVGSAQRKRTLFYMSVNLVIICFSYNDHESFELLTKRTDMAPFLEEADGQTQSSGTRPPFFVVGLKNDLEHKVKDDELKSLASSKSSLITETCSVSCKDNSGISELLVNLSKQAVKHYLENNKPKGNVGKKGKDKPQGGDGGGGVDEGAAICFRMTLGLSNLLPKHNTNSSVVIF